MMQMISSNKLSDYEIDYKHPIQEWDKVKLLNATDKKCNIKCQVKIFDQGIEFPNFNNLLTIYQLLNKDPHINIVKILNVIQQAQQVFVFLEQCDCDLEKLFSKRKSQWFTPDEIYDFLGQIVRAYQHLRKHRIILRDLTPSNILIKTINNRIVLKIADFALSKVLQTDFATTQTGTPFYQAPETRVLSPKYTDQCDIFSLGLILHQLCFNGRKHADIKNEQELNEYHQWLQQRPFQCQINPLIPHELLRLIEKMLQYDPYKRVTWQMLDCQPRLQSTFLILDDCFIDFNKKIGRGAQGSTYLGRNLTTNEEFVAKQISHLEVTGKREIEIYMKLKDKKHKNVVQIQKILVYEAYTYLILEKCEFNLEQYYKMKQKFTYLETLDILYQIICGYLHLKNNNIIHRDLKPENILVSNCIENPIFKITDFGVGKILDQTNLTQTQAGTPLYSAPEVLDGSLEYDHACDIYSLGVMLYYLCYGEHYIQVSNLNDLKYKLSKFATVQFTCPPNPNVEKNLINLIEGMIQYEPDRRIQWNQLEAKEIFNQLKKPVQNYNQIIQEVRLQTQPVPAPVPIPVPVPVPAQVPDIKGFHEYLYTIYQFAIKVDEALDEELKNKSQSLICLGLRLFTLQFCFACFIDINTLFAQRSLTIKGKKYLFQETITLEEWKNSIKFDQEVKQLNSKYNQTQTKLQLTATQNSDFVWKRIKQYYDESIKSVGATTHADVHKIYQEFYKFVDHEVQAEEYSLKLRYFTERMKNLLIECPIEKATNLTKKDILIKIFSNNVYENYLKRNRPLGS